ncbi:MAG: glycosyl hydrolase family 2 [Bacteroidales bacterium]|nr:glycosyl hydrolase family 2 [Bacteroidales bacterium]
MRKLLIILAFLLPLSGMAQSWPEAGREAKAGSRWWWLGSAVDCENLRDNMREYASRGIGALEITPIYGVQGNEANNIEFLSPQWMETLRFVEEEGKKSGIQIDMNFGTGWPFGGPTTPLEEASCKVTWKADTINVVSRRGRVNLDVRISGQDEKYSTLQRVLAYPLGAKEGQHGKYLNLTDLVKDGRLNWRPRKGRWLVVSQYCTRTLSDVKRAAPGGEGLVIDHFDSVAVAHYIQRFEEAFESSGVPYPNTFFNDSYEVYEADWTSRLYEEFLARRGYALEERLPELLTGTGDKAAKVLADYRETLSDLIYEYFTSQWVNWAHGKGVRVRNQAHGSPGNLLDLYGVVDIPEIEGFGLSEFGIRGLRTDPGKTRRNFSDLSMLKYASSAAHTGGKPLTSCETFTWLTEHFRTSLSQFKPDLDLIFCAGINRVFFHGTCYSPVDDPWPGWKFYASVDFSPTNTLWRDAPFFTDYLERCQRFLQWGEPDNDFLIYLPVHDMWRRRQEGLLMMFEISNMGINAPEFISVVHSLDRLGYDCDYVSDRQVSLMHSEDGYIVTSGGTRYKGIIIPEGATLPVATRQVINQMKDEGATVIDGLDKEALVLVARPEEMKSVYGLNCIRRKNAGGYHYFIANLTPDGIAAEISLGVDAAAAILYDPMTGKSGRASLEGGKVSLSLRSGESVILRTFDKKPSAMPPVAGHQLDEKSIDLTSNGWELCFIEEAPAVGRNYSFQTLRTWEGLDERTAITMGTGVYTTSLNMTEEDAVHSWSIDLGDVRESARVYVNGTFVGCAWAVPFILDCGNLFHQGENEIRIEVTNLPANRIADMDRRGVPWRKFHDINVVDINYHHTTYEGWESVPSGLAGKVVLRHY